jgi:hypothetical protein
MAPLNRSVARAGIYFCLDIPARVFRAIARIRDPLPGEAHLNS